MAKVKATELRSGMVVKVSGVVELSGGAIESINEDWFAIDRVGCAGKIRVVFVDDGVVMCKMFDLDEMVKVQDRSPTPTPLSR